MPDVLSMFSSLPLPNLDSANLSDYMIRFALALAVGVIVGSERERSTPDRSAPGVRTFAILSLLGAASAVFGGTVLAAAVLAAFGTALSPTLRRRQDDDHAGYGATTIAAAVTAPLLGALAIYLPALAAATAVAVAVTLASKDRVHAFIRKTVTPEELNDAFKFFVVALIALPLLPNHAFGPFNTINLHRIGFLVTAMTGVGWIGYIAVRTFGSSRGLPLAGLAGGLVSSTATTAAMARKGRTSALRRPAVAAALLSKVSSLGTLALLVWAISPQTLKLLAAPLGVMASVLLVTSRILAKSPESAPDEQDEDNADNDQASDSSRAFALKPALILAGIITAALVASKSAAAFLGSNAVIAVAALTGTADTQAAAVASADLVSGGTLTPMIAMIAVIAALVTNTLLKIVLAYAGGGKNTGRLIARTLIPATFAMIATSAGVIVFVS